MDLQAICADSSHYPGSESLLERFQSDQYSCSLLENGQTKCILFGNMDIFVISLLTNIRWCFDIYRFCLGSFETASLALSLQQKKSIVFVANQCSN